MRKVQFLEYGLIASEEKAFGATFSRQGGISTGAYASLNVSSFVGDHPACVKSNREKVRVASKMEKVIYLRQVHGNTIIEINKENQDQIFEADALFTMEKKIGLAITHADCQAALFFDPNKMAIAAVHAGWRGQMQNIYARMVSYFKTRVNSNSADIRVCISPSLGPDYAEFTNYQNEIPSEYWDYRRNNNHFDLWQLAKSQLVIAGVREKNIHIAKLCTYSHAKDYYSFRREKLTGRNATLIGLIL